VPGIGCIVFSPLAQGLLTDRYLHGVPEGSRAQREGSLRPNMLTSTNLERVRALNAIAAGRGQTLAQMAVAWVLRRPAITSALIGASSVEQLDENLAALEHLEFPPDQLAEIDRYAVDSDINIWQASSSG
jgi:L-glyceraldehyde 3-phosphate reductase